MFKFLAMLTLLLAGAPLQAASAAPQAVIADYKVSLNGLPVAVMHETFESRDGRYQITSETRAKGILALAQRRPGRLTSIGAVDHHGLRPQVFDGTRGNKDARRVHAEFNWEADTLIITHDGRTETVALPAGTQDRLSVMYQFLFLDHAALNGLTFALTNGRKLDHYQYSIGADTAVDTPLGRLQVVHLVKRHAAGETATEIWLAREHRLMPVKMRITEDDGDRYEQIIARLEIQ